MAMFDHGPKGLDQIPKGCRNLRGVSCGKQPLLHKVKLPTSVGMAQCRWVYSNRFVCWKHYGKDEARGEK